MRKHVSAAACLSCEVIATAGQMHLGERMEHSVSCPNLNGPFNPMKNEKCALTLLEVGNAARGNETGARFAGCLRIQRKG